MNKTPMKDFLIIEEIIEYYDYFYALIEYTIFEDAISD